MLYLKKERKVGDLNGNLIGLYYLCILNINRILVLLKAFALFYSGLNFYGAKYQRRQNMWKPTV